MLEIAFDESGNTGANLHDDQQPVCVVGSCSFSFGEANRALAPLRSVLHLPSGAEIKYSRIRSPRAKECLLEVLAQPPFATDTVRAALANKRHMLVFKMVDLLVEPYLYQAGYNMHEDGSAKALANLLAITAPVFGDATSWDAVLEAFPGAVLGNELGPIRIFNRALHRWIRSAPQLKEQGDMIVNSIPYLLQTKREGTMVRADDLDPALPLFVDVARAWSKSVREDFAVMHDSSKIIQRWIQTLENLGQLVDPANDSAHLDRLRIAPGTLRADGDSSQDARLQAADVIVGSIRTWAGRLAMGGDLDDHQTALRRLTEPWVVNSLWIDSSLFDRATGPETI